MSTPDPPPTTGRENPAPSNASDALQALQDELAVYSNYGTTADGRKRRKLTREQSKKQTLKRKELEKKDALELARVEEEYGKDCGEKQKRLRGKNVALEDSVVQGSLIFGSATTTTATTTTIGVSSAKKSVTWEDQAEDIERELEYFTDQGQEEEIADMDDDNEEEDSINLEEEAGVEDEEEDEYDSDPPMESTNQDTTTPPILGKTLGKSKVTTQRKRKLVRKSSQVSSDRTEQMKAAASGQYKGRRMYRLKNFTSHRMALRHGDALEAHARGLNKLAIGRLREVAATVPIAPQVYSSLGLVYENILLEGTHKNDTPETHPPTSSTTSSTSSTTAAPVAAANELSSIRHRIDIATKAYGSYHVAALLCRKDFTLWLRAGDMAVELAELHSMAFTLFMKSSLLRAHSSNLNHPSEMEYHRLEKTKWLQEARDDYQIADNIRPPGITVPAKLAFAQMHLGNYSEALTILTDLKNQAENKSQTIRRRKNSSNIDTQGLSVMIERSELERSYTAWILYADLMLRIGFECKQWNLGVCTNENNAFRRWLKKYSKSFDWKERRLQALCLAFEAAAGSASGRDVVRWVKERASKIVQPSPASDPCDTRGMWFADTYEHIDKSTANDEEQDDPEAESQDKDQLNQDTESVARLPIDETVDKTIDHVETSSTSTTPESSSFYKERQLLIESNRKELAQFDQETIDMMLSSDSQTANERLAARASLKRKHKAMVLKLVGDFQSKKASQPQDEDIIPLPLSASYTTVCDIALQLLKLCLTMELYDGGKLVAEATAKYFRERIARRSSRLERLSRCHTRFVSIKTTPFNVNTETYDDLDASSEKSDDDENYLSDDDAFDNTSEDMLNTGLPPHLQVLYGLSLVGMRSYAYLAQKLLCSLETLPENSTTNNTHYDFDTNLLSDQAWMTFNHEMAQPIDKMESFALVAKTIQKLDMEKEWVNLSTLYRQCLAEFERRSTIGKSEPNQAAQFNKSEYLTILLACFRMKIIKAQTMLSSFHLSDDNVQIQMEAFNILHTIMSKIFQLKEILLKRPDSNATLGPISIETLNIISKVFDLAVYRIKTFSQTSDDKDVDFIKQMFMLTSWLCQVPIAVHSEEDLSSKSVVPFAGFPVSHEWQNSSHKTISKLVHNMCASCCVSAFSGWEKEEFQLQLLKHRRDGSFFGVTLSSPRVAGLLSEDIEKRLALQWIEIGKMFPIISLDFNDSLSKFQESAWYIDTIEKRDSTFKGKAIDLFGEKNALSILLSFSELCLFLAKMSPTNQQESDHLLKYSLSIILPMTQFGLNQKIWTGDIGVKSTDQDAQDWHTFLPRYLFRATIGDSGNEGATAALMSSKSKVSRLSRPLNQSIEQRRSIVAKQRLNDDECPLDSLVEVQIDWLFSEWIKADTVITTQTNTASIEDSLAKMNELDSAVVKLKSCTTVISIQKAALSIAVTLLDVATCYHCYNPFICLHHAAIFASQGSKGGNNDDFFKKPLPPQMQCTPREALGILGRADCLRAIHFSDEAMFLCSYVAGVLSLHRKMDGNRIMTSPDWKAVGIHMYTCAIALDASIYSLMDRDSRNKALESWEGDVQDEIEEARKDASSLREIYSKALPAHWEQDTQDEILESARNDSSSLNENHSNILSTHVIAGPNTIPLYDTSLYHTPTTATLDAFHIPPLIPNYAEPLVSNYVPLSTPTYEMIDDIEIVAL